MNISVGYVSFVEPLAGETREPLRPKIKTIIMGRKRKRVHHNHQDGDCSKNGANPDPTNCSKYNLCTCGTDNKWIKTPQTCPDGLWFNPELLYCDFPENVDCTPIKAVSSFLNANDNETIIVEGNSAFMSVPNAILFYSCLVHGEQAQVGESKSLGFQNCQSFMFHLLQCRRKLPDI